MAVSNLAYCSARNFTYPDDATFAQTALTFANRAVLKTTALALGVLETSMYLFLSAVAYPVSFVRPTAFEAMTSRLQETSHVITSVAWDALYGEESAQISQAKTEGTQEERSRKQEVLMAAQAKLSGMLARASSASHSAQAKLASAKDTAASFVVAHQKPLGIALAGALLATTAVAAYHFWPTMPSQNASPTAPPASTPNVPLASLTPPSNPPNITPVKREEGSSEAIAFVGTIALGTMGTGAYIGGSMGGPLGAVAGAVIAPFYVAFSTFADQS